MHFRHWKTTATNITEGWSFVHWWRAYVINIKPEEDGSSLG